MHENGSERKGVVARTAGLIVMGAIIFLVLIRVGFKGALAA